MFVFLKKQCIHYATVASNVQSSSDSNCADELHANVYSNENTVRALTMISCASDAASRIFSDTCMQRTAAVASSIKYPAPMQYVTVFREHMGARGACSFRVGLGGAAKYASDSMDKLKLFCTELSLQYMCAHFSLPPMLAQVPRQTYVEARRGIVLSCLLTLVTGLGLYFCLVFVPEVEDKCIFGILMGIMFAFSITLGVQSVRAANRVQSNHDDSAVLIHRRLDYESDSESA